MGLWRQRRVVEAEQLLVGELQAVMAKHGRGSARWAAALSDLGNLLMNSDQLDRAINCFRNAADATKASDDTRKDHLTYRLNLGTALRMAGRLDEAEAVFREGVQGRLVFYGRDHAGYAFGLEPLAELLLQRGNAREARPVVEEVVENFRRNSHERIAPALALRAEVVAAEGSDDVLFPYVDQLPDDLVEELVMSVLSRLGEGGPAPSKTVLSGLIAMLEGRLGPDHQMTLNALSAQANFGGDVGDQTGRIEAIQRVLDSYDRQGRTEDAVMAALGLAMAQNDVGDPLAALRTYESAYTRADSTGRPELRGQVLRNWGIVLHEAGQPGPAEQRLTEAVTQARQSTDRDTLGRAQIALGLFLQHENRLVEARPVIEEGLSVLEPVHPEAMIGRSHLSAVIDGRTCGCHNMNNTIENAFREFALAKLPPDLLADLSVTLEDDDFKIDVQLRREPTEEELERLNGVMQSASAEFRRRISDPR